jgi:membrane protease YdiL (CAAX protease family)
MFSKDPARERFPAVWLVLASYVLLIVSRIIDTSLLNRSNEYLSVVVLQLSIFALPVIIYIRLRGVLTTEKLRLTMPRTSHFLLILSATLALITGGLLLSIIFGGINSLENSFSLYETFISKNDGSAVSIIYLVMAYAVLPAICEEIVFRSVLCAEYEGGGMLRAVAFSSLFFGLLHFNLSLFPVYFFAGALLALTMYITRSVLTAVAVHFLYNLFGLFSQPYITTFYKTTGSLGLFIVIVTALFILSVSVFCGQAGRLYRRYSEQNFTPPYPVGMTLHEILASFASAARSVPAIICLVLYIIVIIIVK